MAARTQHELIVRYAPSGGVERLPADFYVSLPPPPPPPLGLGMILAAATEGNGSEASLALLREAWRLRDRG